MARTYFLWDPIEDNIIEEFDEAGNTIADYTTEPYLYGDLVSQNRDGQSRFYCYDILGSTLALTDLAGNVTDTTAYTAHGEVTERTGSTITPMRFIGQKSYFGNEITGDIVVRRRPYQPPLGRWLSADPYFYRKRLNLFVYAENRPLVLLDPSGLDSCWCGNGRIKSTSQIDVTLRAALPLDIEIDIDLPEPPQSTDDYELTNTVLCAACQDYKVTFTCVKCVNKLGKVWIYDVAKDVTLCSFGSVTLEQTAVVVHDVEFELPIPELPIGFKLKIKAIDRVKTTPQELELATTQCRQKFVNEGFPLKHLELKKSKSQYPADDFPPKGGKCEKVDKWPEKLK